MRTFALSLLISLLLSYNAFSHDLSKTIFVAFDTETTGVDAKQGRIVEIGAVKFRGSEIISTTNWLINPGMPIPPAVIKVHGITDKMVKDAPHAKEVLNEFKTYIGNTPLLAHNARFDINFVAYECHRNGIAAPTNATLDSLILSRKYLPKAPAHNLVALSQYLKLDAPIHHRGLADSIYVQEMMPVIFKKMGKKANLSRLKKEALIPWPKIP